MSTPPGPHVRIAEIARQARELLGQLRESRWPGFEPPRTAAAESARAPVRKPAASSRPPVPTGRPAPRTSQAPAAQRLTSPSPPATAATSGGPAHEEAGPWSSLEQIAQAVSTCTKCPLHATRARTVPGEGDVRARLMFVGEAPGADEDRLGRPFIGAAGQLLDKMIVAMGFTRDQVFIANVLKCRPPGNRDPQEHEVAACLPYLRAQIALIRPAVICSLGKHATQALLERKDSLSRLRGRFFDYRGTPLLPTFHPSYLLRTPADKGPAWKDLQLIMQRLGQPLPEPPATQENDR